MIGQSIFLVASDMARELGSVTGVPGGLGHRRSRGIYWAFCMGACWRAEQRTLQVAISYALLAWIGDASRRKIDEELWSTALL